MAIELTPDLCAEVFLRHLDTPVGEDGGPCPLRFVMREAGLPDALPFPRTWENDFISEVDNFSEEKTRGISDAWHLITGRDALKLLDQAMKEA